MQRAQKILAEVFGYQSFRPLQSEIIKNVLEKKDSLVVMPTGGGKSLCYQIPALVFDGLTVVISPLISLMKDQVMQLRLLGIDAAVLNSSIPRSEYSVNYQMTASGKAKMLYLAPESLGREEIRQLLQKVKLECLAVDEAHCISEWGHDFRKDYRQLGKLRENFPSAVCIALTATATPKVQEDIITNLQMKNASKFLGSFNRENLFLEVIKKKNPVEQILNFLQSRKGQSGIIYCFSRADVDDLSTILSSYGFSNKPYHAGLPDEERNRNQELFIREEVDIIVATIAFGMGINKSNVRFIIHSDLPKNLESYYQEIGRSGRDGLRSDCLLLFSFADIRKIKYFIDEKENESERLSAQLHLDAMVKYAKYDQCRRISLINYFGEKFITDNCGMCDNCIESQKSQVDLTIPAQKFLSAVKRTGERFGAGYIIDILTAGPNERMLNYGHDKLSVYNIGNEFDKKTWLVIARLLEIKGLFEREPQFGSLKITEQGTLVLKSRLNVYGSIKEKELPVSAPKIKSSGLFELLRQKRKEIAVKYNIAPFMVFSDKTLLDLSSTKPLTLSEMQRVHGIGVKKLETFGPAFLAVIKAYHSGNKDYKPKKTKTSGHLIKSSRFTDVGEAFNSGKTIEELSANYNIKSETIIAHLLKYCTSGFHLKTNRLKKYVLVPEKEWDQVFNVFREIGTEKLSPLYEKFNGRISYNDLRLLQIIFIQKQNHTK